MLYVVAQLPVPGLPVRVVGDVAIDEGQDFPVALDPYTRGEPSNPRPF
jgi:hypothetical protein